MKKIALAVMVGYCLCAVLLYWIAGDAFHFKAVTTSTVSPGGVVGELTEGVTVSQRFVTQSDYLTGFDVYVVSYNRANEGTLHWQISDEHGTVLSSGDDTTASAFQADTVLHIDLPETLTCGRGQVLYAAFYATDSQAGTAVSLYYGNGTKVARGIVAKSYTEEEKVTVNGSALEGELYFVQQGRDALWFGQYYWAFAGGAGVILAAYLLLMLHRVQQGKKSRTYNFFAALKRYQFLIKQLVARDFKTKYRRSVLGVLWSFLNPLLTMLVQYVVFSTLFKSDIPHYPAYLLTGIVLFNFFSEATSLGMTSITGNSSLITKVYVPKYIYPLSRVLSSTVNILLSLIPLFLVALCTGVMPAVSWLLMVYVLLCLMSFTLGITYILSTLMVYFRDTQFLWNVLNMIWMYCTPIFYPESIIPASLMTVYKVNPMYQILRFARCILIDGVSPQPKAYILCLIVAVVPLVFGIWLFNKKQKDFVLYL